MTISSVGEWRNKAWKNEESTSAIMKRDTGVAVRGNDKTASATRKEQEDFIANAGSGSPEVLTFAFDRAERKECDQAHVALTEALDLPAGCKQREEAARPGTSHAAGSNAARMADRLKKDPAGLAVLQAHCDRGVMSAYAQIPMPKPPGMTMESFLASRPGLEQICDEDAAFKVGFKAFFDGNAEDRTELMAKVEERDLRAGNGVFVHG
jgi:hypothetical protein